MPQPDETDVPDTISDPEDSWEVVGSAGRAVIDADEVDPASRTYWEAEADTYQAEHGAFLAERGALVVDPDAWIDRIDYQRTSGGGGEAGSGGGGFVWGPEGLTEAEAGLLGPVEALMGARVLEVGCGAAQCSRWLAERGVVAVGIDIAIAQLQHAAPHAGSRRVSADRVRSDPTRSRVGPSEPNAILNGASEGGLGIGSGVAGRGAGEPKGRLEVLAASATALPFRDAAFDLAFASYGAVQFVGDLPRLLAEVRRVLRPGGRWVFSVTHPIRWAFPDDPGPAGLTASGSYFDRTPYVERDGSGAAVYAEFHRTVADYVAALVTAGFAIESIVEPEWPQWNDIAWGGWSPLRGTHLPGTLIIGCRADGRAG
jgi:SAM-dependent methyltransferase